MTNKTLEGYRRENMKLLVTIILTLLLAISFYASYDLAVKEKYNTDPLRASSLIIWPFIYGIFAIIILSIIYINQKPNHILGYLITAPFFISCLYLFINMLFRAFMGESSINFSNVVEFILLLMSSKAVSAMFLVLSILIGSCVIYFFFFQFYPRFISSSA